MKITVAHDFLPKAPSVRASQVMDRFGITFEHGQHVIADGIDINVRPGNVVLFTGPSGSGKSSLLRATAEHLKTTSQVVDIDSLQLGDQPLVDALAGSVDDAIRLLSQCGLGEAHLMLRTPVELSEGQRYRYRLALALSQKPDWIVADEFTATLDRTLAKVVAFGVRKMAHRSTTLTSTNQVPRTTTDSTEQLSGSSDHLHSSVVPGFLVATTHEDIKNDLQPDVLVRCNLDGEVTVTRETRQKKDARSRTTFGSVRRPVATGRTSLGGITARTTSG